MNNLKCIAIDDEPLALTQDCGLHQQSPFPGVCQQFQQWIGSTLLPQIQSH